MPDLSPDESSGAEFSLILFSFSKECLTGNHHRSKNTRMQRTKNIQVLCSAQALGRARKCKTIPIHFQGAKGPSSTHGSTCPIPAPGPEGTGCMDGSSFQLHPDLGNSSSRDYSSVPYLLSQVPLGKSVTPKEFMEDHLYTISHPQCCGERLS